MVDRRPTAYEESGATAFQRIAEQTVLTAETDAKQKALAGKGEGQKALQVGLSEAAVLMRKVASFGDPRLYALSVIADRLANSAQPLVPQRLFVNGDGGKDQGPLQMLMNLLLAEKAGFAPSADIDELRTECDQLARDDAATLKIG